MRAATRGWLFVLAQGVLLVVLVVVPFEPHWRQPGWVDVLGSVLVGAGLVYIALGAVQLGASGSGSALTATPVPRSGSTLRTDGLYRLSRHPIYTGVLTSAAGVVLARASLAAAVVWVLLLALLSAKARYEEELLAARFIEYTTYAAVTPRFLPRLGRLFRR